MSVKASIEHRPKSDCPFKHATYFNSNLFFLQVAKVGCELHSVKLQTWPALIECSMHRQCQGTLSPWPCTSCVLQLNIIATMLPPPQPLRGGSKIGAKKMVSWFPGSTPDSLTVLARSASGALLPFFGWEGSPTKITTGKRVPFF